MSAAGVAQTIQLIIAPVVLITACILIENGVLGRYTTLGLQIRSLAHERLELLQSGKKDYFVTERLDEIDLQIPILIKRHRILQHSALLLYFAVTIFLFTMFTIAISVALNSGIVATTALALFIVGTIVLWLGVCLTAHEIRISHQALCYETHQIKSLRV